VRGWLQRAGFDPRFTSLVLALAIVWVALAISTGGVFISPRNLYNLSIQTCVTAIMACGMVYLIVARQIDLSVGSQVAFTGMVIAWVQVSWLDANAPGVWILSIVLGALAGMAIGAFQGWWTAYRGLPAFLVTLAGFLMFRGAAFLVADGQTLAPMATTYQRIGGGIDGSIGPAWSWALAVLVCAWVVAQAYYARRSRARYHAAMAPLWADASKAATVCALVVAFVWVMCAYPDPVTGMGKGIGFPVLILAAVAVALTTVARRTRFGRHVLAYGGNPEAAFLSGLRTKRLVLALFVLMGALCAVAAVITTSRLNSGTHSIGQMAELYVIAATVIGGTSFAGGVGTIPGAIVGAVMIQTLDNGMVLLDVPSAQRQIFIGLILIAAVWLDTAYQRRIAR
jgi:D-xylose transport system permease protein